jgi:retinoid hydroxylase
MPSQTTATPTSKASRTGSPTGGCVAAPSSPTPPGGVSSRPAPRRHQLPAGTGEPESPRRGAAYVRESSEEQGEGFSPGAQRQKIREWAEQAGIEIVAEYCDLHSAWRKSDARPEFQRLMADAADAKFDVVLVFHTSRFARNQAEARRYKQLLRERLGIRVISVTQPLGDDPTEPSSFLAESINEMFDEYYSVSLSFWTRSGLREKARQGHLVGTLPWGYVRDPESKLAVVDPERGPLVLQSYQRYATGQESDASIAAWLNAAGARSARGRPFGKDTVREMLVNAAYAGYVSGLRDKSRSIKGLHEPIVSDELFDRVQEVRSWRTTVLKPSRPSDDYLLRKLLHCDHCGARMHGTTGGRHGIRRYQCSTRRYGGHCEQTMIQAQPLEDQLIDWLAAFQPDEQLRKRILDAIGGQSPEQDEDAQLRRRLVPQLERLRDLYLLGDLTKPEYLLRRQAIEEQLQRAKPPANPNIDRARKLLEDFASFWEVETDPNERRKLIGNLFEHVWQKDGRVVAVKPHAAFASYFTSLQAAEEKPPKGGLKSEVTTAGATGLEPATSGVTGRRSNQLSYAPAFLRGSFRISRPYAHPVCQPARLSADVGANATYVPPRSAAPESRLAVPAHPCRPARAQDWPASQLFGRLRPRLLMPLASPAPLRSYNPLVVLVQDLLDERSATVPFPPGETRPSLARTRRFASDPLPLLLESYERFGPVFTLRLFHANSIFALGPAANHYITVSHSSNFLWRTSYFRDLIAFAGDGLLTTDGDFHRASRQIMLPAFHHQRILASLGTMVDETSSALDSLHPGDTFDLYRFTRRLALRIAMRALFGLDPDSPAARSIDAPALFEQTLSFYSRDYALRMLRGPFTPWARQQRATRLLNRLIYSEISRRRSSGERGEDVLSLLIDASDEDGAALSDSQIRDEVMTLLFAGHDTTTSTVAFMFYELARHPDALARLLAEQESVLAGSPPTPSQLTGSSLPYLEMVLDETLRLYPPAWIGPRRALAPFQLHGHTIPAGAFVNYCSWASHRLPDVFGEPHSFRPERFAPKAKAALPRGAYVPFGGGSRTCIGMRFGQLEVRAIATLILSRFTLSLPDDFQLEVRQMPTISPRAGLPMTVSSRTASPPSQLRAIP